ncbi:SPA1-RELATED 3 protein [Nymphaea thermarum]|nr:SPA1-RELATED 3 protein [Nymphaea thermarum]
MESSEGFLWQLSGSRGSELNPSAVSSNIRGVHGGFSTLQSGQRLPVQVGEKGFEALWTANLDNQIGSSCVSGNEAMGALEPGDISLRQWLDNSNRSVELLECLHIFSQIVEIVNAAHSQGVVVHNIRPSCFVMSSFNRVSFIESASCSSSRSDLNQEAVKLVDERGVGDRSTSSPSCGLSRQRSLSANEGSKLAISATVSYLRGSERNDDGGASRSDVETASGLGSTSAYGTLLSSAEETKEALVIETIEYNEQKRLKRTPLKQILFMEVGWYTSPEESSGSPSTFASDVYRLGVLLFELFSTFSSEEEKLRTMSNLRHRVLPPQLLLKWPKEASFCLWLLHPQPNTRPKMSEVLRSEFLHEPTDNIEEREAAIKIKEEIEEQELLLEVLLQMHQRKQDASSRLHEIVSCLSSDIEEVTSQQSELKKTGSSYIEVDKNQNFGAEKLENLPFPIHREDLMGLHSSKRFKPTDDDFKLAANPGSPNSLVTKSSRVMRNFRRLESAYFSTRCKQIRPPPKIQNTSSPAQNISGRLNTKTEGSNFSSTDNLNAKECQNGAKRSGWVGPFLEGLCKYLSYSKLKVRADLKQRDLLNASNLVCCLGFDRDKEFFATAGVNRKIKVFECNMILNGNLDIHYPVIEMTSSSKLSSICWNSYIKNQIASSDFEGVVQVWDATRGEAFVDLREHERRVWSVDFSQADPTRLASGSDDGAVKLWNINQAILFLHLVDISFETKRTTGGSIGTIRTKANVCCVQFPPDSARTIAMGSADHKIYIYDLRNTRAPLCTLMSHTKTVSYIKFIDPTTLVSASTDNTLKLWDLSSSSSKLLDSPIQTFTGHTNLKNFVGLSVSDGYIATGSETNEVCIYYKAFSMPVLSYKFSTTDPMTGSELDDASQFVSCVCWRGQSSTLVAANSTGNIKILEMV